MEEEELVMADKIMGRERIVAKKRKVVARKVEGRRLMMMGGGC